MLEEYLLSINIFFPLLHFPHKLANIVIIICATPCLPHWVYCPMANLGSFETL